MEDENIEQEFGRKIEEILDLMILIESGTKNQRSNRIKQLKILCANLTDICNKMIEQGITTKLAIDTKQRINNEIALIVKQR